MDKILKTLYLRVDSTNKSLTKNAISQLIIKILYSNTKRLTVREICSECNSVMKCNGTDALVESIVQRLLDDNQIKHKSGQYYLSTAKRNKIDISYQESESRLDRIIDTYFKPCSTDVDEIKGWLTDSIIIFFSEYSSEWIADVSYKHSNAIAHSKHNILSSIESKTLIDKRLVQSERKELSEKFVAFITSKDSDVDALLWEYGTSAFSAKLINASLGADQLAIQALTDSKCVFDTNVLMNIGLESSEYFSAFKSLEKVFYKLNVTPGYLYITQEEYKRTIGNKRDEIINNVDKYPYKVIKETNDTYIQTALKRGCRNTDDFKEFFNQVSHLPDKIEEKVKICLFDSDKELENAVKQNQTDEKKLNELNSIYKSFTGKDKRPSALLHDVGLIGGVNYLREKGKCFILSQEISVNQFAKEKPSINDLPLSIRLETLINMLAIDNGGIEINPQDYTHLFASIIKKGLIPNKEIFKIADLSRMLETEAQITQLPPDEIIKIAKDVNRNRAIGLEDEKIGLELTRKIQGAKLKIVDDLQETKILLDNEQKEKDRYKNKADKSTSAFKRQIEKEEKKKYRNSIRNVKIIFFIAVPISLLLISAIIFYIFKNTTINSLTGYIFGVITDLCVFALTSFFVAIPKVRKMSRDKDLVVSENIRKRLEEELD